jgi:pimeloyl-ACP methyl ester carboxylesterase
MKTQSQFELNRPEKPTGRRESLGVKNDSSRANVDGVSLVWEECGKGIPVICLHDAGHGAIDFDLLWKEAPVGCKLILLDWPGHGRSGADTQTFTLERCVELLHGLMAELKLQRAVLLGTGFGSAAAIAFAIKYPQRIRGLILSEPLCLLEANRRHRRISGTFSLLTATLRRRPAAALAWKIESLLAEHASQVDEAQGSVEKHRDNLRAGLLKLECPLLIALAAKSRAYTLTNFDRLLEQLRGSEEEESKRFQTAVFAGRRSPLWDYPARMARILSGFCGAAMPLESHRHYWTLAAADWPARGLNQWLCTHPGCLAAQALPIGRNPNTTEPIAYGKTRESMP